jgi:hypothetical protein
MASPICKACGNKAKKVERRTVAHLLKDAHQGAIKETQYYFCVTPHCAVVYFSNETAQSFTTGDVRVRVGLKETEDPIPICYCFGHTVASAREEIARTGHSTLVAQITSEIQAGHCACEITNPAGSCCLGDVSRVVKTLLKEHVLCNAEVPISRPAVAGSSPHLVPVPDCCKNQ